MLEFPTWVLAKPWSYISGYAFVDALREVGHEVELALLLNLADETALNRVLDGYAKQGAHFDCAFFWMPHLNYSNTFWRMAERIAERRVAVLIESLRYSQEEIFNYPDLAEHYIDRAKRRTLVLGWLRHCTHVVTLDYHDFLELSRSGYTVFWTPGIIPQVAEDVFIPFEEKSTRILTAATIYGKRQALHQYLADRGIVDVSERLQHSPALIAEFESAIAIIANPPSNGESTAKQAERIRLVRLELWHEYLRHVSKFAGMLSLPAYFKGFPGRVFEGMLAGCAVFVFEACDLERQKKIFLPGEHIHYLSADPNEEDLARIVEIAQDPAYRRRLVTATRDRAFAMCGASFVVERIMSWVDGNEGRMSHSLLRRAIRRAFPRPNRRMRVELSYEDS